MVRPLAKHKGHGVTGSCYMWPPPSMNFQNFDMCWYTRLHILYYLMSRSCPGLHGQDMCPRSFGRLCK